MVVDDDPDVILTIEQGLNRLTNNYRITSATNGQECIEKLNQNLIPDLIILDIMMPGMDGWETFDMIEANADWSKIPIIFLTALDDHKTMEKGIKTGSYCIKKPFNIKQLKDLIDRVLQEENPTTDSLF